MFLELESNISQETCYIICFFMEIRSYKKRGTNYHWISGFENVQSSVWTCVWIFYQRTLLSEVCFTCALLSFLPKKCAQLVVWLLI